MKPITDPLVKAIKQSGLSMLALEKRTGVLRQSITDFVAGRRRLQTHNADALASFFKLELRPRENKGK